ncbi:class I SAM-dependent DNA methyltransferase [Leptospira wolffii]|uniref:Class I SAM-dependent DNA methyltransferase n=1 Tax=Leptospira wolffii TaxID=409998 RepID=A0ABV5BQQ3_9LEPT
MEDNVFNRLASMYDTEERIQLAKIISEAVKPEIQGSKKGTLLDYGCGTGLVGLELHSLVDRLFLVDSSEQMLEIVKEKITRNNIANAETIHADLRKSDIDIRADLILASLVLLHVPVLGGLLKNLRTILNKSGKLIIVDFDKNELVHHPKIHNGFTHEELESLLLGAGFHGVKIRTFHRGKNIFMNQDASLLISTSFT